MKQQSLWHLLCIQIGGAICLPVIMVGQMLAQSYGFLPALAMILGGNLLLLAYGLFSAKMGMGSGKSTIELAVGRFGRYGPLLFGAIFLMSMLGWFAIQINVITESIVHVLPALHLSPLLCNLGLGALMTAVSACGIRGLRVLSQWSLPLLVGTLAVAMFTVTGTIIPPTLPFSVAGISLVIATAIGAVIDLPTYWRYARTHKEGLWAIAILFGIALPVIEFLGVYLGAHTGGGTVVGMLTQGGGVLWSLWVALFLLVAGWTTNNTNLYSAGANSFALLPKLSFAQRTIVIGAMGTMLSCLNVLSHFTLALEMMGIMIASMGAVMVCTYWRKGIYVQSNYIACALGIAIGFCSLFHLFPGTGAPVIDAFASSAIASFGLQRLRRSNAIPTRS